MQHCGVTTRMSIGQFAKLTHLSVKALRHYHETAVLAPAVVDADTGYRYYEHSQAHRAHLVRRLREADMPLAEIADLLGADGDAGDRRERVEAHADALARRAQALADAAAGLREALGQNVGTLDIVRRELDPNPGLVVVERCGLDVVEDVCIRSFARLDDAATSSGFEVAGPGAASFDDAVFESEGAVMCALPIARPSGETGSAASLPVGVVLGSTPGGVFLTAVHVGARSELGVTYSALGAHVDQLGVAAARPVVERYLVPLGEDTELRTEVCWPVLS